jgi:hypothetical protein
LISTTRLQGFLHRHLYHWTLVMTYMIRLQFETKCLFLQFYFVCQI